jgi:hypothetical protein
VVGVLFLAASVFQLIDRLNLVATPPDVPESANLVDRVLASIPYRQSIWPVYFATNVLFALGFIALVGLGLALAARIARSDDRRHLLQWTLVTAGILGAVGQLVLVGAVKASIDIPYCDCGFKNEEIVSQVWAEMVVQSAVQLLVDAAGLLAAAGIVVAARAFAGRAMPASWAWLSYLVGAIVVLNAVLDFTGIAGDANEWLLTLLTLVLIPAWALWVAASFVGEPAAEGSARAAATG